MGTKRSTTHRSQPVMELVGRQAEIAQILDIVEEEQSEPRMLLLLGEAGTGKTGLLAVAVNHARTTERSCWRLRAARRSRGSPSRPCTSCCSPSCPTSARSRPSAGALETAFGIAPAEDRPTRCCSVWRC